MDSTELALQVARKIFFCGVEAVIPSNLIRNQCKMNGSILNVQKLSVNLKDFKRSYIVGFGKAVLPMAEEILSIIDPQLIDRCILSVPEGTRKSANPKIEIYEGAKNNAPDQAAFEAAQRIVHIVQSCTAEDLLIVLISGGGSALLPFPRPPITLDEKTGLFQQLSLNGATITELNSVRKVISIVKGGGLVNLCPAGQIVSLILSDVLGDRLDVIASGPTVPNTDAKEAAWQVVTKYIPHNHLDANIADALANPVVYPVEIFSKVENLILGNNTIALEASAVQANLENLVSVILTNSLEGEARLVGSVIADLCNLTSLLLNHPAQDGSKTRLEEILGQLNLAADSSEILWECIERAKITKQNMCLLFGGETTVSVKGTGRGGRNQELALASSITLNSYTQAKSLWGNVTILCGGTDGIDGPCDAAGAIINSSTFSTAAFQGLNSVQFLENNDSYNFFRQLSNGKFHLMTGHTGTNVIDLVVAIIDYKDISLLL